jgi:hypothetical protein
MKLTRRQLAWLLAGPEPSRPQPETREESAEQLLAAARERLRRNTEALAKVQIPTATEPAFQFRAS